MALYSSHDDERAKLPHLIGLGPRLVAQWYKSNDIGSENLRKVEDTLRQNRKLLGPTWDEVFSLIDPPTQ